MVSRKMNSTVPTLRLKRRKSRRAITSASLILHRNWLSNVLPRKSDKLNSELPPRKKPRKRQKPMPSRNILNSTWQ